LAPIFADVRAAGHVSLRAIAAELTQRGMRIDATGFVADLRRACVTPRGSVA